MYEDSESQLELFAQQKRESRLENNINGRLFSELKKIGMKDNKKIFFIRDCSGNYLNEFIYDGKEISAWIRIIGVEVGDYEGGTKEYFLSIFDLARCPDLVQAVKIVENSRGIYFSTNNTINLLECFKLVGNDNMREPALIMVERGLKDLAKITEILKKIIENLQNCFDSDFDIKYNNMTYKIFIIAKHGSAIQKIINISPDFVHSVEKAQEYFSNNMPSLFEIIDNAILHQNPDSEIKYKTDLQRIKNINN